MDDKAPIIVVINTPGGCLYNGFGIYDRIRESPCPVIGMGYGAIMSAGALIMQGCDLRQVSPNSTIMVHDGTTTVVDSAPKSLMAWAESDKAMCKNMHKIFFDRMVKKNVHLTLGEVEELFSHDRVLIADEAVKLGIIDSVIAKPVRVYEK